MEAVLGEGGQQQDFLQKPLLRWTEALPPAAQHGWGKEQHLSGHNWAFCTKIFSAKCFSSLSTCGFIRILPIPLLGARTWWQQMQACWQKACFSFSTFCRLFRRPSQTRHPQLRITGFSLWDQIWKQQSSVQFDGSKRIHTLKHSFPGFSCLRAGPVLDATELLKPTGLPPFRCNVKGVLLLC